MKRLGLSVILLTLLLQLASLVASKTSKAEVAEKPQVVLLVSLAPELYPKGLAAALHGNYESYPLKLENTFRDAFKNSEFELKVVQDADRYDLYQVLHAPNTVGVFWVSHAAPVSWSKNPGISIDPLLVDSHLSDVSSLFREIDPRIKWVSLVSCGSNIVIHSIQKNDPQNLKIQGFDQMTDANRGLKEAIKLSHSVLTGTLAQEAIQASTVSETGIPAIIHRIAIADANLAATFFPALTIESDGHVIGAIPQLTLKPGQTSTQDQEIFLPTLDSRITLESGFDENKIPENFNMGKLEASSPTDHSTWKVFADSDGVPYGITEQDLIHSVNP